MSILVFLETETGKVKNTSIEAIAYAKGIGGEVIAIALGDAEKSELESMGNYGATKVLHASDGRLNQGIIKAYSTVFAQAMDSSGADVFVLANSSIGTPSAARAAVKIDASLATNVIELPDITAGFRVKRSIYTGKAYCITEMIKDKKVITIKKNAAEINRTTEVASVEDYQVNLNDSDFTTSITNKEKASGDVLLPEAEIVVSGGRGMKGPENWGILEDLAKSLGAGLACSKPVSDMEWRPHHEHVGQTGVKVSPNLYIAVGISGAIQHLAGVNSSKFIVVINKDPEAPFFKAADYGIVGDAFEVVPKLTAALKEKL